MKTLKVLFLSPGNSIHTERWVNALSDRGAEVHLIYCKNHNIENRQIKKNITQHILPYKAPWGYYSNAQKLNKLFHQINPDICNVHYASGYGTLARLANIKPLILSVWGSDVYDFPYKSYWNMKVIQKNINYADQIASTSYAMAEQVNNLNVELKRKIAITPFGVNLELFKFGNMNFNTNDEKHITIGTVKGLDKKYGIDTLIKVFHKVKKKTSLDINLLIYGDGPQENQLISLINELKLNDVVHLKGKILNSEVPNALSLMNIFCCFSRMESFGVAAIEAMSVGLPIIATKAEGFKEVVTEDSGFLENIDDIDALVKKLELLINDLTLRKKLGISGRKQVEKLYDWNKNVDDMINLYINVLEGGL